MVFRGGNGGVPLQGLKARVGQWISQMEGVGKSLGG